MIWFLSWLFAVELFALGALPMAVRLFRFLPDRGFFFAKPLGSCWWVTLPGSSRSCGFCASSRERSVAADSPSRVSLAGMGKDDGEGTVPQPSTGHGGAEAVPLGACGRIA